VRVVPAARRRRFLTVVGASARARQSEAIEKAKANVSAVVSTRPGTTNDLLAVEDCVAFSGRERNRL
jgi:hypothetical protein